METQYKLIENRQWNNEGITEHFTGTENECFEWIQKNTSFSFHEATTRQGYSLNKL